MGRPLCPDCGSDLFFCDDGEGDELEKKIYACHDDDCLVEIIDIYRSRPEKS